MGYCMSYQQGNARFKIEVKDKILQAIKNLRGKESVQDSSGRHFRWVNNDFYKIDNIEKMFREWGWHLKEDKEDGYFIITEFLGEKLGDDDILLNCIAPYMEDSYIEMYGEDAAIWRWVFQDGTFKETMAEISWRY